MTRTTTKVRTQAVKTKKVLTTTPPVVGETVKDPALLDKNAMPPSANQNKVIPDTSGENATPPAQKEKDKKPPEAKDEMKTYDVLSAVRCYGKDYPEGSTIDLSDEHAADPLAHNAIKLTDEGNA